MPARADGYITCVSLAKREHPASQQHPPFLIRSDGCVERLHGTATVLGLFKEWDCEDDLTLVVAREK